MVDGEIPNELNTTNQKPFITNNNLIYLKGKLDEGNVNADEIASIILTKKSYQKFCDCSFDDLFNSTKETNTECIKSTKKTAPKKGNKKKKGLKKHFYWLYKLTHGKKKK